MYHRACVLDPDQEALQDLKELEGLIPQIPAHEKDAEFHAQLYDLVEQIRDVCPYTSQPKLIRGLVAHFGDAYFFFNKTGDVCFLSALLAEIKAAETAISE